jgi:hypothetical protein
VISPKENVSFSQEANSIMAANEATVPENIFIMRFILANSFG